MALHILLSVRSWRGFLYLSLLISSSTFLLFFHEIFLAGALDDDMMDDRPGDGCYLYLYRITRFGVFDIDNRKVNIDDLGEGARYWILLIYRSFYNLFFFNSPHFISLIS